MSLVPPSFSPSLQLLTTFYLLPFSSNISTPFLFWAAYLISFFSCILYFHPFVSNLIILLWKILQVLLQGALIYVHFALDQVFSDGSLRLILPFIHSLALHFNPCSFLHSYHLYSLWVQRFYEDSSARGHTLHQLVECCAFDLLPLQVGHAVQEIKQHTALLQLLTEQIM